MKNKPALPPVPGDDKLQEPIAIVGMGGVFPGARTLEEFWRIVERGIDTSKSVPPGRWILDSREIQSTEVNAPDRVYTDRACFIENFQLDRAGLQLDPTLLDSLDPSVHLLLEAGRNAFQSARNETVDRNRIGVILGNIALPTSGSSALCEQVLNPLLEQKTLGRSIAAPSLAKTALNRYVSGLPAGVLAQALGLGGGVYTLDAACASSLYAIKLACDELQAGRADAMLAGGLSRPDSLYTQMGFSQLRALAQSGRCAPFDAAGSGLIVGEGAGVLVLKRLSDALRVGDQIHAVIRGIGLSNDLDGNLLSPSSEGQLRALKQAYQQAGWSPDQVDMIECHATGTPVGDAVEFESLSNLWHGAPYDPGQCVLGAVKANIGHLLTAAGSASMIKILLALKNNILPATANFRQPAEKIPLADSPFQVLQESKPWPRRDTHTPRRAAINGFGFGGINAHILIEEWLGQPSTPIAPAVPIPKASPIAVVGLAAHVGRWSTLREFQARVLGGGKEELPAERANWRGLPSEDLRKLTAQQRSFPGYYLDDLSIPVNRYRIPPRELAELLPQQALMLEAANAALKDAQLPLIDPTRTGVFIGLGLDLRTTDFHFRWATLGRRNDFEANSAANGQSTWAQQVTEGSSPALTADRTMGALAGINASRIAKEFHFGGPSHTVCSEDCSGTRALEIAVRALQKGEVDQALAGAVDLTGDLRTLLATDAIRPYSRQGTARPFDTSADGPVPGEGAVALVLKRLADAERDGDRIYAVIRGIGSASGSAIGATPISTASYQQSLERAYQEAQIDPATVGYVDASGVGHLEEDRNEARVLSSFFASEQRKAPCRVSSATADVGHTGAASGLVSVVKACLALYQEILPPLRGIQQPLAELTGATNLTTSATPQYWVRDRVNGPRRAGISSTSVDGNCMHVVLEAREEPLGERASLERVRPMGPRAEALFVMRAQAPADLSNQLEALRELTAASNGNSIEILGRNWWRKSSHVAGSAVLTLVAQDAAQLLRLLKHAGEMVQSGSQSTANNALKTQDRDRIFYTPHNQQVRGGLAFVFPGAGSYFAGMGRELAVQWPEILRAQDRENQFLASQMFTARFWNETANQETGTDHRAVICGQVSLGTVVSDLAQSFGLKPNAALGYSLGESTSLFALRAWTARDEMLRRVSSSTLFAQDLTGTPDKLRQVWQVPANQKLEWKAGLVDRSAAIVRAALEGRPHIYVLIVNTPNECVVGGDAPEVALLVEKLGCHWFPLEGVSTVHCELLRPVEQPYRELHLFDTTPPAGVKFFSGGWGRSYEPTREKAAEAIVAQASSCIDFPRVVRAAYSAGIRFFIEMGPGNSCTRMIGQILEGQPHVARSLCISAQEPLLAVLRAFGHLIAEGVSVDLEKLYGKSSGLIDEPEVHTEKSPRRVPISITGPVFAPPRRPIAPAPIPETPPVRIVRPIPAAAPIKAEPVTAAVAESMDPFEAEFFKGMAESQTAVLNAHQAYLNFSQGVFDTLSRTVESQFRLISGQPVPSFGNASVAAPTIPQSQPVTRSQPPVALDREACLEFARGSVANVLGEAFRQVDSFPTRVRLPDEPLMLVDRILEIHGEARSMTHGRVITEHDVLADSWYLDCNRIPTCVAVEAGQADLFLSGYLGIDFQTKGKAVYRLLDAKVCFHRGLPGPGSVIHYDIRIERFFQQSDTWLFRFNFESTVDGQPLLTMTEGCAGFFTEAALASGKGIVRTTMDLKPMPGKRSADWRDFVTMGVESYSTSQLDALRDGDFKTCFGPQFAQLPLRQPLTLPSGLMKLVHRIPHLDPQGGRFGLGLIRGEADIHPKDWFLTCHFVDDRVMPGTLMFECCLHTLRVFLLRMGWVLEQEQAGLEPVPGIVSQLKCRGQVLETTSKVTYEVSLKEIGYRPEPYVIADALMYADGKPIVEITNMSLRYAGVTRETFEQIWSANKITATKRVLYDAARIRAFAVGKPSDAFGAPYQVFDEKRRIARLPGPPYQFLDRITDVQGEPFKMVGGASAEADYDIPENEWYFAENRQGDMPFAVLLEIALQPCGWLAAYVGSALTSETDLSFRNLGGTGKQFMPVYPNTGTLTTRVKMTRVSSSAGMIIQWFDLEVQCAAGLVYKGDTYFGFFPKTALEKQEGIQNAKLYQPADTELLRSQPLAYPTQPPYAGEQLRMVDHIEIFIPDGGTHKLGFIRGTKRVQPDEWFFKAHFYQDPVVPGSLGLESFLQLLKFLAIHRWGHQPGLRWEAVAIGEPHEWIYRGQIIPVDHLVTIEAVVTAIDDEKKLLTADGFLSVDGRVIYGMKRFTVRQQQIETGKELC